MRDRRTWLKEVGAAGAGIMIGGVAAPQAQSNGAIVPRTSTSGVFTPPRGRGFMKFSFDFPEPSIAFDGFEFSFRVFTHENTYALSQPHLTTRPIDGGLELSCTELVWAGGQRRAPGRLTARLTRRTAPDAVECEAAVEMERPIKAVAMILRGVPRGRISAGGAPFFDPRDDEVLLGYPFPAAISLVRRATAA
jgi:hypothetical protein